MMHVQKRCIIVRLYFRKLPHWLFETFEAVVSANAFQNCGANSQVQTCGLEVCLAIHTDITDVSAEVTQLIA